MIEAWTACITLLISLRGDLSWKCVFLTSRSSRAPCLSLTIALGLQNGKLLVLNQKCWCWKSWSHVIPHHVQNNGKLIQNTMTSRFQRYYLWRMDFSLVHRKSNMSTSLDHGEVPLRQAYLPWHSKWKGKNTCSVGRSQTVNLKIPSPWTFYSGVPAHESTSFILGKCWRRRIWEGRELSSK